MFLSVFKDIKPLIKDQIVDNLIYLSSSSLASATKYLLQINISTFIDNLISHPDASYRKAIRKIVFSCISVILREQELSLHSEDMASKLVLTLVDVVLDVMRTTIYENAFRSLEFFILLKDLYVNVNKSMQNYMLSKGIFLRSLEILMGKENPFVKYLPKVQDFQSDNVKPVIQLIQLILKSKKNIKGSDHDI